jgi:hypothetical protein
MEVAAATGFSPRAADRRIRLLVERGICRRDESGVAPGGPNEPWLIHAAQRNMLYLSDLLAGLADVGALADFSARHKPDR